mgnify:CR=1 FL=1
MRERLEKQVRLAARWLLTIVVIGFVVRWVDTSALWQELVHFSPYVLVPALALTVFQVALSAWRWRYTVSRLGLPLAYLVDEHLVEEGDDFYISRPFSHCVNIFFPVSAKPSRCFMPCSSSLVVA